MIVARAHPQVPTDEGWRGPGARGRRARRARGREPLDRRAVRARGDARAPRCSCSFPAATRRRRPAPRESVLAEMEASLVRATRSRSGAAAIAEDPAELPRAASEALLAANVAQGSADGAALAFEQTGAYRLLLSAMSENPSELQRFYAETVEPLVAYDEQYETDLLLTLETFLEADGNVAGTAQRLFTHRHTIYYRLERVRELSGLDVSSSDGREKLSLGLKAMRVLGIASAAGPATEAGAEGGRVPAPLRPAPVSAPQRVADAELDRVGGARPPGADDGGHRRVAATPASRYSPASMISRCGGEAIHAATMRSGVASASRSPREVLPDRQRRGAPSG